MRDDNGAATRLRQHGGGYLAGECPLGLTMHILSSDRNRRPFHGLYRGRERREGWRNDNVAVHAALHERRERRQIRPGLRLRFVHFPIPRDYRSPHRTFSPPSLRFSLYVTYVERSYDLFVRASTPGNFLPAKNSSDAPPPVEMWETLSASPAA